MLGSSLALRCASKNSTPGSTRRSHKYFATEDSSESPFARNDASNLPPPVLSASGKKRPRVSDMRLVGDSTGKRRRLAPVVVDTEVSPSKPPSNGNLNGTQATANATSLDESDDDIPFSARTFRNSSRSPVQPCQLQPTISAAPSTPTRMAAPTRIATPTKDLRTSRKVEVQVPVKSPFVNKFGNGHVSNLSATRNLVVTTPTKKRGSAVEKTPTKRTPIPSISALELLTGRRPQMSLQSPHRPQGMASCPVSPSTPTKRSPKSAVELLIEKRSPAKVAENISPSRRQRDVTISTAQTPVKKIKVSSSLSAEEVFFGRRTSIKSITKPALQKTPSAPPSPVPCTSSKAFYAPAVPKGIPIPSPLKAPEMPRPQLSRVVSVASTKKDVHSVNPKGALNPVTPSKKVLNPVTPSKKVLTPSVSATDLLLGPRTPSKKQLYVTAHRNDTAPSVDEKVEVSERISKASIEQIAVESTSTTQIMKETSITVERNVKITEISSASSAKASAETKAVPIPIPTSISEAQVLAARKAIARRLNERSFSKELIGIKEQYDKIYDLLDRTVRRGESNSILLVGNRATGKTTLVRKALQNLVGTFPKQANGQQPFLQINLSGLLQTDDRLALKEIVRQLHLQQSVDMANVTSGSFADCLHYVLETLRAGSVQSTPVVFVLEDIDLFAQHPKQALLYNLFDVCQSSQNPLAVVGLTTRIDFVDLLEKRVKSRFSHRQVCLYPPESFTDFTDIVKQAVHLIEDDGIEAEYMWAFNATVDTSLSGTPLVEVMKDIFEEDKDVRRVFRVLLPVVIRLSTSNPYVDAGILSQRKRLYSRTDPTVTTISSLSVLELILLVAMLQHERRQVDKYNFEMVYDEYREFIKRVGALGRGSGSLLYVKGVALKAFERLMALELCRGTEGVGVRCPKEYRMVKLVVGQADIVEGVRAFEGCPDAVTRWALR